VSIEDPADLAAWVTRFPKIRVSRLVENGLYLVALILEIPPGPVAQPHRPSLPQVSPCPEGDEGTMPTRSGGGGDEWLDGFALLIKTLGPWDRILYGELGSERRRRVWI
jgi:hypothetical protein